jgi:hypothetical protein
MNLRNMQRRRLMMPPHPVLAQVARAEIETRLRDTRIWHWLAAVPERR